MDIMKLLLPIIAFLMMGCEHSLQIQGKGDIVSASQQRNCTYEQQICSNIVVADYIETYTAVPRNGWIFDSWQGCNSETNTCSFNIPAANVKAFWGETFVLLAIFKELPPAPVVPPVVIIPAPEPEPPAPVVPPVVIIPAPEPEPPAPVVIIPEPEPEPEPVKAEDGDVTWSKEISSVGGHRVFEVRYQSRTNIGKVTEVSGWIAKPNPAIHPKPADGYPVMAFAHGTTGLADMCAPTNNSSPTSTIPLLLEFLDKGFVVTATDYQGLGTEGIHHYLNGISEGQAVLDSVRAAIDFAKGGKKAVLFGHSQGGHAVVFANELAKSYAPELNIVGTIGSGTGIVDSQGLIIEHIKHSYYKGYLMMVAVAQNAAYGDKEVPLSRWLTPAGIDASKALENICVGELVATYGSLSADYLFVEGAPLASTSNKYDPLADATPGLKVGASPLLMIHGRRDPQIPSQALVPWIEETCGRGQDIYLKWFDTGHRVPYEAPSAVLDFLTPWIEARFAGLPVPSNCDNIPRS